VILSLTNHLTISKRPQHTDSTLLRTPTHSDTTQRYLLTQLQQRTQHTHGTQSHFTEPAAAPQRWLLTAYGLRSPASPGAGRIAASNLPTDCLACRPELRYNVAKRIKQFCSPPAASDGLLATKLRPIDEPSDSQWPALDKLADVACIPVPTAYDVCRIPTEPDGSTVANSVAISVADAKSAWPDKLRAEDFELKRKCNEKFALWRQ